LTKDCHVLLLMPQPVRLADLERYRQMNHEAAKRYHRSIRLESPQTIQSMLANALEHHRVGRLNEAEELYRRILTVDPRQADCLHLLGMIAYQAGHHEAAVEMIGRAIAINSQGASYHTNLGTVLQSQGRLDESAESYQRALTLNPTLAEVHTNLGNILQIQGKLEEAVACHEKALELKPALDEARYNLSLAQLLQGNFTSGWHNFEKRWHAEKFRMQMRHYPQARWAGEKLAAGRVLVWGEQGVGDEIMFAGLVPDVIRAGHRCLLDCDPRLQPLFARSFPGIDVISRHDAGHDPAMDIATHIPGGSLPGLFRSTLAAFAETTSPYLRADPIERERFRTRYAKLDSGRRRLIGLAWHTNNRQSGRYRSIDLSSFAPLLALPDIQWISLQYGDPDELENQAVSANASILIDRSVDQFANIDIFAAQIAALDMVITIDNSTAHLAGALGVSAWVLLPSVPDWRWLEDRENSLWYPTLRLFRQTERGDWDSVVQEVLSELRGIESRVV